MDFKITIIQIVVSLMLGFTISHNLISAPADHREEMAAIAKCAKENQ